MQYAREMASILYDYLVALDAKGELPEELDRSIILGSHSIRTHTEMAAFVAERVLRSWKMLP